MKKQRLCLVASLAYMVLIFLLSSTAGREDGLSIPAPWDKFAHVVEFGVLGYLLYHALEWAKWQWALAFAVAMLFGLSDEIHQSFVPGREASGWDVLADALGAFLGASLTQIAGRRAPVGPVLTRGRRLR